MADEMRAVEPREVTAGNAQPKMDRTLEGGVQPSSCPLHSESDRIVASPRNDATCHKTHQTGGERPAARGALVFLKMPVQLE